MKVGDEAPDFELSDSTGRAYRLSDFRREKPVVLEFFRSGDMKLTETLADRQAWLEKRLVDVAHKNAPRRLAELLLQLRERYGIRDARGTILRIKLSQSVLGNLLGVSREIVSHSVSDLKRRGVLEIVDGRVIIQNQEALAAAAA